MKTPRVHSITGKVIPRCPCGKCVYAGGRCFTCLGLEGKTIDQIVKQIQTAAALSEPRREP